MTFPIPLISPCTEKAMSVCHTALFPPTEFPETSLNISFKAAEQWRGSGCPDALTILRYCSDTASTVQREGELCGLLDLENFLLYLLFVIKFLCTTI